MLKLIFKSFSFLDVVSTVLSACDKYLSFSIVPVLGLNTGWVTVKVTRGSRFRVRLILGAFGWLALTGSIVKLKGPPPNKE